MWSAFVERWASLYVGYPNVIRLDQEVSFTSELFLDATYAHGITLQFSGTKSHNSIGVVEKYHAPLRCIFRIAREKYPSMDPKIILRYVVTAVYDTLVPEGLVPSLLDYGEMPSFPCSKKDFKIQTERMGVIRTSWT